MLSGEFPYQYLGDFLNNTICFLFLDVEMYFMPWLLERVEGELNESVISRTVLDGKYCS